MGFVEGACDSDEGGETGAVVGDSGSEEAITFAAHFYFRGRRENRVEMCGEKNNFFFGRAGELSDDVSGFIDLYFEARRGQEQFYGGGALGFLKWRSRNLGQADLLLVNPSEIVSKPGKCGADLGIVGKIRAAAKGTMVVRCAGRADGHGHEDNPKSGVFHRGVRGE